MKLKRMLGAALALVLALALVPGAYAAETTEENETAISVTLNGEPLSFNEFVPELDAETGRTFLPLRQVFEALGCASGDITWDAGTQTATAKRWGVTVSLTLGSTDATVTEGGKTRTETMDAAPYIKTDAAGGGYVYVPVRFAAQALGCAVDWDDATRTVVITDDFLTAEDAAGVISFVNLGDRVRSNSVSVQTLEENIAYLEEYNFDKMQKDARDALNMLADAQWSAITGVYNIPGVGTITTSPDSYTAGVLQQRYEATRQIFDDLKEGKIQKNTADAILQLRNAENQVVMGAEVYYVVITELEASRASLQRQIRALDRMIQSLQLRYELGQISALQLEQAKSGRTAALSGQQTLEMNIATYKLQLEQLIGAELTGKSTLTTLPSVSDAELSAMDLEADLEAARVASYELHAAKIALDDAEEDWKDAKKDLSYHSYRYRQAEHTWQAAQYTYESAVQDYERRFRVLYLQVKDYAQVLAASKTALALEQREYAAEKAKYDLGNLSANALADAQDEVSAAQDTVDTAARNLFSAYNNYRWAVDYGILN